MATNLFKPEAKRQREAKQAIDIILCFLIFALFIASVIYLGLRAADADEAKSIVKTHQK